MNFNLKQFFRDDINKFYPWPLFSEYYDGSEYKEGFLKIDTGESNYDLPDGIMGDLKKLPVKYYPGVSDELARLTAQKDGVTTNQIFFGNGSKDLIILINRLFLNPDDEVILLPPTYPLFGYFVELNYGKVINVPRRNMTEPDVAAIKKAVTARTKVIIIDNPSNPFGYAASETMLREILDLGIITVVDEAYYEFYGVSAAKLLPEYPNLIILRTFSKLYGLAGLRLGYSISSPEIQEGFVRVKTPHQMTVLSQYIAKEALKKIDGEKRAQELRAGRTYLLAELKKIPYLKTYDSVGAYVVVQVLDTRVDLYTHCYKNKIAIKKMDFPDMGNNFLRFNVVPMPLAKKIIAVIQSYAV